jgi:hypothetical protein
MKDNNDSLIRELQRLLWAGKEVRSFFENSGVKISPCNFYSSIFSISEIENSYEYSSDVPPYAASPIFGLPEMSRDLLKMLTGYSSEFQPPDGGSEESPACYFWKTTNLVTQMQCHTMPF